MHLDGNGRPSLCGNLVIYLKEFFFSFHIVVQGMQNEMYHFNHF